MQNMNSEILKIATPKLTVRRQFLKNFDVFDEFRNIMYSLIPNIITFI